MNLDTIPHDHNGEPTALDKEGEPRALRSLLLQALEYGPTAGFMQIAERIQPAPAKADHVQARADLADKITAANGEIELSAEERETLLACVAAQYPIGAVAITRAMKEESEDG